MDESKKKLILAIVAVAALGAAGYTMFGGGSGNNIQATGPAKEIKRVKREPVTTTKKAARKRRRTVDPVKASVKRVDRSGNERASSKTKKRRGRGKRLEKKKKIVPNS